MRITISPLRTLVSALPEEIERARAEFERSHCLSLPGFFGPELVQSVQRGLAQETFYERTHHGIGAELCLNPGTTSAMMEFVANDPALFQAIRQLTGCNPIGCFEGRVYRMFPGRGHFDSWHSDVDGERLIALSVNLGTEPYEGGLLQICDRRTGQQVHEVANVGTGDAILFRIASSLGHRVTALDGTVPRTAYAGWFRSKPDYQSLLAERLAHAVDLRCPAEEAV